MPRRLVVSLNDSRLREGWDIIVDIWESGRFLSSICFLFAFVCTVLVLESDASAVLKD